MTDKITKEQRSRNMSRIRSRDTGPEKLVRSILHRMGFRFRICRKDLPGKPDIVLSRYKTVIFVNGCFWHRHKGCKDATIPKTNTEFWLSKLNANAERDIRIHNQLESLGWMILVVWACELKKNNMENLKKSLRAQIINE